MRKKPIVCFVAMKIGDPETDAVYHKVIRPVVKHLIKQMPHRSDKIVHNQRIDWWIENELAKCDVVVADLTFARPSVYWEAGRAEGRVPVVYTCRRDHLKPRPDDEHGNFRVHFDLQTKNIIDWSSPTDRRFPGRLSARLRHVLAPTLRERAQDLQARAEAAAFAQLSIHTRRHQLVDVAITTGEAVGFRSTQPKGKRDRISRAIRNTSLDGQWLAVRSTRDAIETVFVTVLFRSPGVGELRRLHYHWENGVSHGEGEAYRRGKAFDEHLVIVTLSRVVPSGIERALADFTPMHVDGSHMWARDFGERTVHVTDRLPSRVDPSIAGVLPGGHGYRGRKTVSVYLVANVQSKSHGRQQLEAVFAQIRGGGATTAKGKGRARARPTEGARVVASVPPQISWTPS